LGAVRPVGERVSWPSRRGALLRAALAFAGLNLAWETLQVPLYTIWWTEPASRIAFAVVHCAAGDLLISCFMLAAALSTVGRSWPQKRVARTRVSAFTTLLGLAYTVGSEWVNVAIRGTWAYTEWMPRLPPLGTGLAPALQWLVLPGLALYLATQHQSQPDMRATSASASPITSTQHVQ
jgi:hypothetical protein